MKTIGISKLRSGNFELTNNLEFADHKFKTQKSLIEWYDNNGKHQNRFGMGQKFFGYIVKSRYSRSQTYFNDGQEVVDFLKKNSMI